MNTNSTQFTLLQPVHRVEQKVAKLRLGERRDSGFFFVVLEEQATIERIQYLEEVFRGFVRQYRVGEVFGGFFFFFACDLHCWNVGS